MQSIATIPTASASRYLQQLCKHWSHKFEVEFDPHAGRIEFGASTARFAASGDALTITLDTADAAQLDRMEPVVAEHLQRFAFREDLAVAWSRASG